MQIVFLIFTISVFVSSLYWLVLFVTLSCHKTKASYTKNTKTSILVAAKNEVDNLKKLLPLLIKQSVVDREIVILDDFSTDNTAEVIKSFEPNINYHHALQDSLGKKSIMSEGINQSKFQHILLIDADCIPASLEWAAIMSSSLKNRKEIVLGYGPYIKSKGFLNLFVRFETAMSAVQYFSYALLDRPYMAVGRNLAFTKELFQKINGYASHRHVVSGDDDLFIQEAATSKNVQICLDHNSFTYSESPKSFKSYIRQKRRHVSTASYYSLFSKVALSIHPFFFLVAVVSGIVLCFNGLWNLVLMAFVLRWVLMLSFGYGALNKLNELDLIPYLPLLDLCWIPYYIFFSIPSFRGQSKQW